MKIVNYLIVLVAAVILNFFVYNEGVKKGQELAYVVGCSDQMYEMAIMFYSMQTGEMPPMGKAMIFAENAFSYCATTGLQVRKQRCLDNGQNGLCLTN